MLTFFCLIQSLFSFFNNVLYYSKFHCVEPSMKLFKMQVVYFVNSGSEANELAMMMARLYTGNLDMISLRNAYHGGSSATIGLTALNTWKYPIPQVCLHRIASQILSI
jgi:4-aminobutyrate aminotransferase-like enzyme